MKTQTEAEGAIALTVYTPWPLGPLPVSNLAQGTSSINFTLARMRFVSTSYATCALNILNNPEIEKEEAGSLKPEGATKI